MSSAKTAAKSRRPLRAAEVEAGSSSEGATSAGMLATFLVALILPVYFDIGTLRFSPYRLLLLIMFVPMLLTVLSGKVGRVRAIDVCFILLGVWIAIAMSVNHGSTQIAFTGITVVELVGGYLVGRCFIRNSTDYRLFFRYFFYCLVFMFPFVILEQITQKPLLNQLLGTVLRTHADYSGEQRLGLNRVQGFFEHPILYGMFCSLGIANFYFLTSGLVKRLAMTGFATFMTAMAVSTAPLLSIVLQFGLIAWDKVTKGKWLLLTGLASAAYVLIDLLSNRTPFHVLVTYGTLKQGSAYNRLLIWEYGTQNVAEHPFFGLGMADWERPFWMVASVDNFWLLTAMRYGLPAFGLMAVGLAAMIWAIVRRKGLGADDAACRLAYMVSLTGLFLVLGTVHVWAATSVLVTFYMGAGVWLAQSDGTIAETGTEAADQPPARRAAGARRDPLAPDRAADASEAEVPRAGPRRRLEGPVRRPPPERRRP